MLGSIPVTHAKGSMMTLLLGIIFLSLLLAQTLASSSSSGSPSLTAFVGKTRTAEGNDQNNSTTTEPHGYNVLKEQILYSHWRILLQRMVELPNGKVVDFDIVSQKGAGAAIIFVWDSHTKTATLVREYNPGPHELLYGLAAGLIDQQDHQEADPRITAENELNEECHLEGGTWHLLTKIPVAMDKYVDFRVHAYLVIDPTQVEHPRPLDNEEIIEIVPRVSVDEIKRMVREGEMNMVGSWASLLALEKLRDLGEL